LSSAARGRAVAWVFLGAASLFYVTPVRQLSDSYYSLLLAHQIAAHGALDLGGYFAGDLDSERFPGARFDGLPYQVKRYGDRILYEFPLGAPLLATPWMAVADAMGAGVLDADGHYDRDRERRHQRLLAALFSACFVAGAYAAARRLLAPRPALATTAALALATPLWSTASRGYWSHTAALALVGGILVLLAARAQGSDRGGLRLGLLAAGAYVCRPTLSILLVLIGLTLLVRRDRRALGRYALGAAPVLGGLVMISELTWGSLLPPYYTASRLGLPRLEALAGVLVSPSRGLLVFEPVLIVLLLYVVLRRDELRYRGLARLGGAGLALHTLAVASFAHWWGGHGYGPRLFTETVFYQTLLAFAAVATLVERGTLDRGWRRGLVALVLLGVGIHAGGALSKQGNLWDSRPAEVDRHPERLWEWSDPQWLAWLNKEPRLAEPAPEPEAPAVAAPAPRPRSAPPSKLEQRERRRQIDEARKQRRAEKRRRRHARRP